MQKKQHSSPKMLEEVVFSILKGPTDYLIESHWKMGLPAEIAVIVIRSDTKAHHQYNVAPN